MRPHATWSRGGCGSGAGPLLAVVVLLPTAIGLALASSLFYYEIAVQYFLVLTLLYVALDGLHEDAHAGGVVDTCRARTPAFLRWIWGTTDRLRAAMLMPQDSGRLPWQPFARVMLASVALGWAMTLVFGVLLGRSWGVILWREILESLLDVVVFVPMLFAVTTLLVDFAGVSSRGSAGRIGRREGLDMGQAAPVVSGGAGSEHGLRAVGLGASTGVVVLPQRFRQFLWLGMAFCGVGFVLGVRIWMGPLEPGEGSVRAVLQAIATGPWAR